MPQFLFDQTEFVERAVVVRRPVLDLGQCVGGFLVLPLGFEKIGDFKLRLDRVRLLLFPFLQDFHRLFLILPLVQDGCQSAVAADGRLAGRILLKADPVVRLGLGQKGRILIAERLLLIGRGDIVIDFRIVGIQPRGGLKRGQRLVILSPGIVIDPFGVIDFSSPAGTAACRKKEEQKDGQTRLDLGHHRFTGGLIQFFVHHVRVPNSPLSRKPDGKKEKLGE